MARISGSEAWCFQLQLRRARRQAGRYGSNVLFGPAVEIYTATHPLSSIERRKWLELAKPVTIGSDVWIGGAPMICPGVTIGDGCVIGAGSVVTREIPAHVFAADNPCRAIRSIEEPS